MAKATASKGIVSVHVSAEQMRVMLVDWEYKHRACIFQMQGQYLSEVYVFRSGLQLAWAKKNMDKLDQAGGSTRYVITPRLFVGADFGEQMRWRASLVPRNKRRGA